MYWIHESKPVKLKTSCSMIPTNLSWDRTLCLCLLISSSTFHLFQQKFWFSSFEQLRYVSSHQSRWTLHFKFFKRSSSKEVSQACGLDKKIGLWVEWHQQQQQQRRRQLQWHWLMKSSSQLAIFVKTWQQFKIVNRVALHMNVFSS